MDASHLVATYGYWIVLLAVTLGSAGVPFPATAIFVAAAVYAGSTHELNIATVIIVGATGAILGTLLGYLLGRTGGLKLIERYGRRLHLTDERLHLGEYLFNRYGTRTILFGRFVAPLRTFVGFLAGLNHMPWNKFLPPAVISAVVWAFVWGVGSYVVGDNKHEVTFPGSTLIVVLLIIAAVVYLRRFLRRLAAEAKSTPAGQPDSVPGDLPPV
jgi:membrane protein DedA with SNARE-associated domain